MEDDAFEVPASALEAPSSELCVAAKTSVRLPVEMMENHDIFSQVINLKTWNHLSDDNKLHLMKFLPKFPKDNVAELQNTLRMLFQRSNFKFSNPLEDFYQKLHNGHYHPEVQKYLKLAKLGQERETKLWKRKYYTDLFQDILLNRRLLLEYAYNHPSGEPIDREELFSIPKFTYSQKLYALKCKTKYQKILKEVREECNASDTSESEGDEGEEEMTFYGIPSKLLANNKDPDFPNEQVESSVISTLDPARSNQMPEEKILRPEFSLSISEDDIMSMLKRHRKRKAVTENSPEFTTSGRTLEGIIERTQTSIQNFIQENSVQRPKRRRSTNLKKRYIKEDAQNYKNRSSVDSPFNFLCLIRDIVKSEPDKRITVASLEQKLNDYDCHKSLPGEEADDIDLNDKINKALRFLAGDTLNIVEQFVPYVDFKERAGLYVWIGDGRDSDEELESLCRAWIENYEEWNMEESTKLEKTSFKVRPSNEEEKLEFRRQESERFNNAHQPYTYKMHGYNSVVGPVKRVFKKEESGSKEARDHSILTKDRPHYVTILTLVRDAVARLPNGEGTRADICELLKDSQFLLPNVSDSQLNTVVSGALDRLHYERDPCVKFEMYRKVWIYLHRGRTMEHYEKLHRAQEAALKARKALIKPKSQRAKEATAITPVVKVEKIREEFSPVEAKKSIPISLESNIVNEFANVTPVKLEKYPEPVTKSDSSAVDNLKLGLGMTSVPIAVVSNPSTSFLKQGQIKTVQLAPVGALNLINLQGSKLLQVPTTQSQTLFSQVLNKQSPKKEGGLTYVQRILPTNQNVTAVPMSAATNTIVTTQSSGGSSTFHLTLNASTIQPNRTKQLTIQQLTEAQLAKGKKFNFQKIQGLQNARVVSMDEESMKKAGMTTGQPIIIGGKTVQLARKPIQVSVSKPGVVQLAGKTVQLAGKPLTTVQLVSKQTRTPINQGARVQLQTIKTEEVVSNTLQTSTPNVIITKNTNSNFCS
ncbi:DgyrCDS324 [Dimorphilus gyrociliatus]|uniref:DgyrCDS324 n=1 Tax=Dimorphilus gyrociliatus TaxID=2664684 RepID=A0A7I8V5Q9_9ANNE|nr:DgyrCDS324 [Dimorphilus gyrociliatus]